MLLYMLLASLLAIEKLAYDDPVMNTKSIDLQYDNDLKGRLEFNSLIGSGPSKTMDLYQTKNHNADHVMLTKAQYEELKKGGTIKIGHNVRLRAKAVPMPIGIFDSSKLSIFVISILLIVYGSFRALGDDDAACSKLNADGSSNPQNSMITSNDVSTLDSYQAIFLPLGASLSLLIMFLFFDSLQLVFAICTSVLATVAFAFLLLPMWKYLLRSCSTGQKISLGYCGRYTAAEMVSFTVSLCIVIVWIMTGHWLLMDALGMGLCVAFIALVRLPSLKVSTLLLVGLLVYDVFWVFLSPYIFNANVMVKVATKQADNPVGVLAKKLRITGMVANVPKLSLPGKLVFPSYQDNSHFSMLGLGDIVMPGLLLCFVLRYDIYKRRLANQLPPPATAPTYTQRITYFQCSLFGYFLGLIMATVISEVCQAAQPALLYLVPFTLLPLFTMAYLKGDLKGMWTEPFTSNSEKEEKKKLIDV